MAKQLQSFTLIFHLASKELRLCLTRISLNLLSTKKNTLSGWWLGHPSEKYDKSSIGMMRFPIVMGKCQIDGNHSPPTSYKPLDLETRVFPVVDARI